MSLVKVFLLISLAGFAFVVCGQKPIKGSTTLTNPILCQINGLTFQCPQGFSEFFKSEKEGLLLFRENKKKNSDYL